MLLLGWRLRSWDRIFLNWESNVCSRRTAISLALISRATYSVLATEVMILWYYWSRSFNYWRLTQTGTAAWSHIFLNSSRTSCCILLYLLSKCCKWWLYIHSKVICALRILEYKGVWAFMTNMLLDLLVLWSMHERSFWRSSTSFTLIWLWASIPATDGLMLIIMNHCGAIQSRRGLSDMSLHCGPCRQHVSLGDCISKESRLVRVSRQRWGAASAMCVAFFHF